MSRILTLTHGSMWRLTLLSLLDLFKVQSNQHLPFKVCRVLAYKNQHPYTGAASDSFFLPSPVMVGETVNDAAPTGLLVYLPDHQWAGSERNGEVIG